MSSDSDLKKAVLDELSWEPSVDEAHIGVTAHAGIVTLTGHVGNYMHKVAAEKAASRVKGVKAVAEEIEVKLPFDIKRSDEDIAAAAVDRLAWNSRIPADAIMVKVRSGWVTLTGNVGWHFEKEDAESDIRALSGVHWLHTTSSLLFTFYRAGEKRGDIPRDLQGGVVVHDHFLPYRGMDAVDHAFCNAHILRELRALIEIDKEPWAEQMRDLLLDANAAVNKAREAAETALPPKTVADFVERYWDAVRLGLSFHRQLPKLEQNASPRGRPKQREGHNLLERLKTFKTETVRFLTDFDVPFTNNLAEQDLRMMKVKMKISGSFRTLEGAQIFASLRCVVSTARKQGCNILQILAAAPSQIMLALTA